MEIKFSEEIKGEYVLLRKVTIEDAQDIYNWRKGLSGKFMRHPDGYSILSQEAWIRNRDNSEANYIIVDAETKEKVGMIGIYEVNTHDKVANVGRLLLAEKFLKTSTPYGLESLLLCYDYVLNTLNFRKITGDIHAKNIEMYKMQIFLGMKQEGYLIEHVLINGVAEDLYIMSINQQQFVGYKNKIKFLLKRFNKPSEIN